MSSVSSVISALLETPASPVIVNKAPVPAPKPATVPAAAPSKVAKTPVLSPAHARIAEVFASPHAVGRSKVCNTLLAAPQNWSAAAIIKELPYMPTDAEHETQNQKAASDRVWEKANAKIDARSGRSSAGDPQSKAQQILAGQGRTAKPITSKAAKSLDAQGVWDWANAKIGRRHMSALLTNASEDLRDMPAWNQALPTRAELEQQAQSSNVWDRAYAKVALRKGTHR